MSQGERVSKAKDEILYILQIFIMELHSQMQINVIVRTSHFFVGGGVLPTDREYSQCNLSPTVKCLLFELLHFIDSSSEGLIETE